MSTFDGPPEQHRRYAELSRRVMVHVDHIVGSPPETRPSAISGLLHALWDIAGEAAAPGDGEHGGPGRKAAKTEQPR